VDKREDMKDQEIGIGMACNYNQSYNIDSYLAAKWNYNVEL